MAFTDPTIADFKNYFVRDFPYGTDPSVAILDQDIANAFLLTDTNINQDMWPSQSAYNLAFFYLSAHYLVLNIRQSTQGINGQFDWAHASKAAGPVNEAFEIPQRIKDNPDFMAFTKTNYGAFYLNLLWPLLSGQVFTVCGGTHP